MIPFFLSLPIVLGAATSDPTPPAPAEIAPPEIAAAPGAEDQADATTAPADTASGTEQPAPADAEPGAGAQQPAAEAAPADAEPSSATEDPAEGAAAQEPAAAGDAAPAPGDSASGADGGGSDSSTPPAAADGADPDAATAEGAGTDTASGDSGTTDPMPAEVPAAAGADTGFPISDAAWTLTELNGAAFGSTATLTFFEPGRIAGKAPCNNFSGAITGTADSFAIGPVATTQMACPDLEAEQKFLAALASMTAAEVTEDTVVLTGADGASLTFVLPQTSDQAPE